MLLAAYLSAIVEAGWGYGSVKGAVYAIRAVLVDAGVPLPPEFATIRSFPEGTRCLLNRAVFKAKAFGTDALYALVASAMLAEDLLFIRDVLMLVVGTSFCWRPAALVAVRFEGCKLSEQGLSVFFPGSVNKASKLDRFKAIARHSSRSSCPVRLFERYVVRMGFQRGHSGLLFVPIHSVSGPRFAAKLSTDWVRRMVKARLGEEFTGRSLRVSGGEAGRLAGLSKQQVKFLGDWSSDAMLGYLRGPFMEDFDLHSKVFDDGSEVFVASPASRELLEQLVMPDLTEIDESFFAETGQCWTGALSRSELQAELMRRGLLAVGRTAELRDRLTVAVFDDV